MRNVLELLDDSLRAYGDKTAFIDERNKITYSELIRKVRSIATFILSRALEHKPIVVITRRNIESVVMLLGVMYSGNIYLPMDYRQPVDKIIAAQESVGNNVVLCSNSDVELLNEHSGLEIITAEEACESGINNKLLENVKQNITDTDSMCCFLTSGTTGKPKVVLKSHGNVLSMAEIFTDKFGFSPDDVFGCQTSLDFDSSNKSVFISLYLGATVYMIPESFFIFPGRLIPALNENRVSVLIWSVSVLSILAKINVMKKEVPGYVKKVMFSGEAIQYDTIRYWKEKLQDTVFVNLYGPTEMTGNALYYEVKEIIENEPIPMGRTLPDTQVCLFDEEMKPVCEKNVKGELYIGGRCLAVCYYNDPEKTAERFVQDPMSCLHPEMLYRTGDFAYINDSGDYVFAGRRDLQIKRNGYRIELSEIEAIINASGTVNACCCIYNKERNEMILYYQEDHDMNEQLIQLMKRKLSRYMMPDKLVRLDRMPLNSHDKIDREKLTMRKNMIKR